MRDSFPRVHRLPLAGVAFACVCTGLAACASQSGPREIDVSGQPAPVAAPEAVAANLTGTWQLNPGASQQMRRPSGGVPMGDVGGGGGRGRRGGGVPSGGAPPTGAVPGEGEAPGAAALRGAALRLVITQTDSTITIVRPRQRPLTLFFDGRDVWVPGIGADDEVPMNARWHRGRLAVRRGVSDRRSILETYELSRNGRRLTIRVQMPGGGTEMAPGEIRRVYDRLEPGEGRPQG